MAPLKLGAGRLTVGFDGSTDPQSREGRCACYGRTTCAYVSRGYLFLVSSPAPSHLPPSLSPCVSKRVRCAQIEQCFWRRSTIGVHHIFSEAPHSRSSIPHPKTDSSKNQICTPMNSPMAPSIQTRHFSEQDWHFDDFGLSSIIQKTV